MQLDTGATGLETCSDDARFSVHSNSTGIMFAHLSGTAMSCSLMALSQQSCGNALWDAYLVSVLKA